MALSTEELRRLLNRPAGSDIANALKEWRFQLGYSQPEAAIHLGVSLRTLQGWEAGRPMPYPSLLQRPIDITARPTDRLGLLQSEFPREFVSFIDFLGADNIDKTLDKVRRKLHSLSPSVRTLFGDRFYFHDQWDRFTEAPNAFQVDLTDLRSTRAASLIAGVNRIRRALSLQGQARFRSMMLDNLQPDRDIRQIEHEIRCYTHFLHKRASVTFADLEGRGQFDLLIEAAKTAFEVECKTVTEDTGSQIKIDLSVNLSEAFRRCVLKRPLVKESGLFFLTFKRPTAECKNVDQQLRKILCSDNPKMQETADFSWRFSARSKWQTLFDSQQVNELRQQVLNDSEIADRTHCIIKAHEHLLGLVLIPHKPTTLSQRVVGVIKDAADQCSKKRSSVVWLHFVGLAEKEFLALAEFSSDGKGAGLNAIVANALHPEASTTDRTHVERVRFSASPDALSRHLSVGPTMLFSEAISVGGTVYDVPNPFRRLPQIANL
jgi:transcriptional regulator with XRE-family HTH domain